MKTTLIIEDGLMRAIKARAAMLGETLSGLVEKLLRAGLLAHTEQRADRVAEELPAFDMGLPRVDITDRESLEHVMGGRLRGFEPPAPARRKPRASTAKRKVRARR